MPIPTISNLPIALKCRPIVVRVVNAPIFAQVLQRKPSFQILQNSAVILLVQPLVDPVNEPYNSVSTPSTNTDGDIPFFWLVKHGYKLAIPSHEMKFITTVE